MNIEIKSKEDLTKFHTVLAHNLMPSNKNS